MLEANSFPYGMSPGNHDQYPSGVANFYDQFFPPSRFLGHPWYGGYLGAEAGETNRLNKDNYELFSVGGLDFLIIHIETDWPAYAVTWADKIIKRYPNRRVILSTHAFLNTSSARPTATQFGRTDGTMSAEAVWQQLIRPNCNVFMVINGHYPGEGRRTDLNNCGQPVHQVLSDYQSRANGGDGWLRLLHVQALREQDLRLHVLARRATRARAQFETDANSQFVLDYAMQGTPFTVIGDEHRRQLRLEQHDRVERPPAGQRVRVVRHGERRQGHDDRARLELHRLERDANTAPVAVNNAYTVAEDATLTVTGTGVLGNDTDADDNNLTAILVQGPTHGTLALSPFGSFVYTPVANYNGPDSFTYKANDGSADVHRRDGLDHGHAGQRCPGREQRQLHRRRRHVLTVSGLGVLANDNDPDGEHPDGRARPGADSRRRWC